MEPTQSPNGSDNQTPNDANAQTPDVKKERKAAKQALCGCCVILSLPILVLFGFPFFLTIADWIRADFEITRLANEGEPRTTLRCFGEYCPSCLPEKRLPERFWRELDELEALGEPFGVSFQHVKVRKEDFTRLARLENLRALELSRCPEVTDANCAALVDFPRLDELTLDHCAKITQSGLAAIGPIRSVRFYPNSDTDMEPFFDALAQLTDLRRLDLRLDSLDAPLVRGLEKLQQLTALSLSGAYLSDAIGSVAQLTHLEELSLYCGPSYTAAAPASEPIPGNGSPLAGLSQLTKLRVLTLHLLVRDTSALKNIGSILGRIGTLRKLDLYGGQTAEGIWPLTDADLAGLGPLRLEELDVRGDQIEGKFLAELNSSALRRLDLSGTKITDEAFAALGTAPNLVELDLGGTKIGDPALARLAESTKLESVQLQGTLITDAGLAGLENGSSLKRLDLSDCPGITGSGLARLSNHVGLTSLHLAGCRRFADESLEWMRPFVNIEELDLTWCEQIGDDRLDVLAKMTNLRSLKLRCCDRITDAGLAKIAPLSKLESLDLSWCGELTDESMATLGRMTELKALGLKRVWRITDAGLARIAPLSKLESLDLTWCDLLTDQSAETLMAFPHMTAIDLEHCDRMRKKTIRKIQMKIQKKLLAQFKRREGNDWPRKHGASAT